MSQLLKSRKPEQKSIDGQFVVRPFDAETDVPRCVRLFAEVDAVDRVDKSITEQEFSERLGEPGHDPARDRLVVEDPNDPDHLIAHIVSGKSANNPGSWVVARVHPDWRGRGIGRRLVTWALARSREQGATHADSGAVVGLPFAHSFLEHLGFKQVQSFVLMRLSPQTPLAEPELPPGYTIRPYTEVNDIPTLTNALNRGFIGHWDQHDDTEEEIAHWLKSEDVRPEGIFLAYGPQGDVAGVCIATIGEGRALRRGVPTGYIDSLAVVPEHRSHGLGRALLLTGMRLLRAEGQEVVELDAIGDNELALPLYEGVGFTVARRELIYRISLADEWVIRRLDFEKDVPRLVTLINEVEDVDRVDQRITEAELREALAWPEGDPLLDRWVVEEPGNPDRLIAQGNTGKSSTAESARVGVKVHPNWRRRGLGSQLLSRAIERGREKGATYVTAGADKRQIAGHPFLRRHGFRADEGLIYMRADAETQLAEPQPPEGYTIRPYSEVDSIPPLMTALNRGFSDHYENHDATEQEIAHWLSSEHTRPDGIFLAYGPEGDAAGVCWADISPDRNAKRGEPIGYIDALAVVPEHRRRGLARALLLLGMRWLRANGQGAVELDAWGHNDRALPLYYNVGFKVTQEGTHYRLDLDEF
ncbi:MAG: GNAT family N-acetyltransferase [Chloroflexia bacterium]